jgi:hypothetical protein
LNSNRDTRYRRDANVGYEELMDPLSVDVHFEASEDVQELGLELAIALGLNAFSAWSMSPVLADSVVRVDCRPAWETVGVECTGRYMEGGTA